MSIVILQLPDVKRKTEKRPQECPYCQGETFQLRYLLIRLSDNWHRYRVFDWRPEVPWTNNATEQAIGRMKMRALLSVDINPGRACGLVCC
jgi:hypothetical protein